MDNCIDTDPTEYAMGDYGTKGSYEDRMKPDEFVHNMVRDNRIVVFSKTKCPYCDNSKSLLQNLGVEFKSVELDEMKEGSEVQSMLGQLTDARTVPRIFIDGKCVGGNSDLQLLNSTGQLSDRLKKTFSMT